MRILIVLAMMAALAHPQAFEVASIKPSGPNSFRGSDGGPGSSDPTLYRFGRVTVLDLVMHAYHVDPFQVSSKTALDQVEFDLTAKMPAGASKQEFQAMLRNLLAERFHFKAHMESRELPAYELIVARTGPSLKDSVPPNADGWPHLRPGRPDGSTAFSITGDFELIRLRARQEPVSMLARMLHVGDDAPVVDKTGLTGAFDFSLEYATPTGDIGSEPPPAPDLSVALEKQLGLQIVRKRLPFDVVVVDAVDKLPTPN